MMRAQNERDPPAYRAAMPRLQQAMQSVKVLKERLIGLSGRALQTNNASASKRPVTV